MSCFSGRDTSENALQFFRKTEASWCVYLLNASNMRVRVLNKKYTGCDTIAFYFIFLAGQPSTLRLQ